MKKSSHYAIFLCHNWKTAKFSNGFYSYMQWGENRKKNLLLCASYIRIWLNQTFFQISKNTKVIRFFLTFSDNFMNCTLALWHESMSFIQKSWLMEPKTSNISIKSDIISSLKELWRRKNWPPSLCPNQTTPPNHTTTTTLCLITFCWEVQFSSF